MSNYLLRSFKKKQKTKKTACSCEEKSQSCNLRVGGSLPRDDLCKTSNNIRNNIPKQISTRDSGAFLSS